MRTEPDGERLVAVQHGQAERRTCEMTYFRVEDSI